MENPANPFIQTTPHSSIIVNGRSCTYDEFILGNIPPGYRFRPTDEELVLHYLKRKVYSGSLPPNKIHTTNVYEFSPQDIPARFGKSEENEWYFFTPTEKGNIAGTRTKRRTPNGQWRSTKGGTPIMSQNGEQIGLKKKLVYQKQNGVKSKRNWIMHEYSLSAYPSVPIDGSAAGSDTQRLNILVLCRIHNNKKNYDRSLNNSATGEVGEDIDRGENQNPAAVVVTSEDHEQSVDMVASDMNQEYNVNENQDDNLGHHMMNYESISFFSWITQDEFAVPISDFDAMLCPPPPNYQDPPGN